MKVAVLSTAGRSGTTVATMLMGFTMAHTQGRTVRLCYTGENAAIKRYVGLAPENRDATRTISQVSKLLDAGAIPVEELGDYCMKLGPNIELMDSWDRTLTEEEVTSLLVLAFSKATTSYAFCDLAYDLEDSTSRAVLKVCDAIVVVSEPSKVSLDAVRNLQKSKAWPKDKPAMLLVSKWSEEISAVRTMADQAGFKLSSTCKLHFNPFIAHACNIGQLDSVIPFIVRKDPRVVDLNADLRECTQFLLSLDSGKIRWEG